MKGLKTQLPSAMLMLVMAEMYGATSGLGYFVINYTNYANYTNVVAGIIMVGVVVTVLNSLVGLLERKTVKWSECEKGTVPFSHFRRKDVVMSAGKANCLVCGEPILYFEEAQDVTCVVCGKQETGHSICSAGHYVCDACHRAGGVDHVIEYCLGSGSENPVDMAIELMRDQSIYPNGPEHHTLVGAALMAAYRNAGGDWGNSRDSIERAIQWLTARAPQVRQKAEEKNR